MITVKKLIREKVEDHVEENYELPEESKRTLEKALSLVLNDMDFA